MFTALAAQKPIEEKSSPSYSDSPRADVVGVRAGSLCQEAEQKGLFVPVTDFFLSLPRNLATCLKRFIFVGAFVLFCLPRR